MQQRVLVLHFHYTLAVYRGDTVLDCEMVGRHDTALAWDQPSHNEAIVMARIQSDMATVLCRLEYIRIT